METWCLLKKRRVPIEVRFPPMICALRNKELSLGKANCETVHFEFRIVIPFVDSIVVCSLNKECTL